MRVICRLQELDLPATSNSQDVPSRRRKLLHSCDRMALERKTEKMPTSQKDQLAAEAIDRWGDFQESLSSVKRKYPIHQFQAFGQQQNDTPN
jgi:hypothetical protein